ncbi:MAG: contractile injection system protein, VgrG/Pvc8 family [Halanaerobiales bacterium]
MLSINLLEVETGYKMLIEEVFGLNSEKTPEDNLKKIEDELQQKKELEIEEFKDDNILEIKYKLEDNDQEIVTLFAAAGLPVSVFDVAEKEYREELKNNGGDYEYELEGCAVSGTLAQYAGVVCSDFLDSYRVVTYNSPGIGTLLNFRGHEFYGVKLGLLFYLYELYGKSKGKDRSLLDKLEDALFDRGVIRYNPEYTKINVADNFRDRFREKIFYNRLKNEVIEVTKNVLELDEEKAEKVVENNFDSRLVERKMRVIDKYKAHKEKAERQAVHYIFSDNLPARLFPHIGRTYLVDKELRNQDKLGENLIKKIETVESEEQFERFTRVNRDLFEPFFLLKKEGNGRRAKNRHGKEPEIGQITDRVSQDYLRALVKDIVLDMKAQDEEIMNEIFRLCRRRDETELTEAVCDRLRLSMKDRGLIPEEELNYQSHLLQENPDLFEGLEKVYPLDRVVIKQFEDMYLGEIQDLWQWKLSGDGIFLILGDSGEEDGEDEEKETIEYHSENDEVETIDSSPEEIELKLEEPSRHLICGSTRALPDYRPHRDIDYRHKEDNSYNFSSGHGAGFLINCRWTNPEKKIKVDGKELGGIYEEIEREEADIGDREKTLRDRYFEENIILRYFDISRGRLAGKLIYLYGPDKENELIIDGFVSGDYGIELKELTKEKEKEDKMKTYTPYRVKFDNLEFVDLKKFEINKEIYRHSTLKVYGLVRETEAEEYFKHLKKEDTEVVVTCLEDERKILFKGMVENCKLIQKNQLHYIKFKAVSYSRLLERRYKNRLFQNEGTTYGDILERIKEDNSEFHLLFGEQELEDKEVLTEKRPVILQYDESEWDFFGRLISETGNLLVVDDTKDDSETINILAGTHDAAPKPLNNKHGRKVQKTKKGGWKFVYYKVEKYLYRTSEEEDGDGSDSGESEEEDFERPVPEVGSCVEYNADRKGERTKELIVVGNRIYIKDGCLYSDLKLMEEEEITARVRRRKREIAGRSFRGEIKDVKSDYTAQVEFANLQDDFDSGSSYYYPVDRFYQGVYYAPEVGDIVDVYFGQEEKPRPSIRSTLHNDDINNQPAEKVIFTPGGYTIKLNDEKLIIHNKEKEVYFEITEEGVKEKLGGSEVKIDEDKIRLVTAKEEAVVNNEENSLRLETGSRSVRISDKGIEFE